MMRMRGEAPHVSALIIGTGYRAEFCLPIAFGRGTRAGEALQRLFIGACRNQETADSQNRQDGNVSHADSLFLLVGYVSGHQAEQVTAKKCQNQIISRRFYDEKQNAICISDKRLARQLLEFWWIGLRGCSTPN